MLELVIWFNKTPVSRLFHFFSIRDGMCHHATGITYLNEHRNPPSSLLIPLSSSDVAPLQTVEPFLLLAPWRLLGHPLRPTARLRQRGEKWIYAWSNMHEETIYHRDHVNLLPIYSAHEMWLFHFMLFHYISMVDVDTEILCYMEHRGATWSLPFCVGQYLTNQDTASSPTAAPAQLGSTCCRLLRKAGWLWIVYRGVEPKIGGKKTQIIHLFIGFGTIVFTIHFRVPVFLEGHPYRWSYIVWESWTLMHWVLWTGYILIWLVVSTNPSEKYARQNGNLPQIGMKIKNIWNHHLVIYFDCFRFYVFVS